LLSIHSFFFCFFGFLFTFTGILTPSDEFQFWIEQVHRGSKQINKERASNFKELFETIARVCDSNIVIFHACKSTLGFSFHYIFLF
jgi:hypothetical protein